MRSHFSCAATAALVSLITSWACLGDEFTPQARGSGSVASGAGARPDEGNALLRQAVARLDSYSSVTARVRQRIDLFGRRLVGSGAYAQLGPVDGRLVKLSQRIPVGDISTGMTQVRDGRYLWIRRDWGDETKVSRVDLRRLAARREASPPPIVPARALGSAGLSRLLAELEGNFDFDPPTEQLWGDLPLWVVQGRWKPERLAEVLPQHQARIAAGQPLPPEAWPPQLPSGARLSLGKQDLFPYRVQYLRPGETAANPTPAVTLELFDVRLNAPLDPLEFNFVPGDVEVIDATEDW